MIKNTKIMDKKWTIQDIVNAMRNELSEKQKNHINNKKNEKKKK